jgi:hypothetical protein
MALTPTETRLRALLGERIPVGGTEVDTFFADAEITTLLTSSGGNLIRAAYEGWQQKAAEYSNLVNITEGNSSRENAKLLEGALKMVKQYGQSGDSLTAGRTRIGRIRRSI